MTYVGWRGGILLSGGNMVYISFCTLMHLRGQRSNYLTQHGIRDGIIGIPETQPRKNVNDV